MSTPSHEGHGVLDLAHSSKKDPLEPSKSSVPTKTYIFDLELGESNEETYPEFSWTELVRGAKAKERLAKSKQGLIALDPYASDDEDDLKAMAARFEQKYSSKGSSKNKKRRVEEFMDRGAGYDDNDSFIDNTDVYDEVVPPGVQTAHGGFYINSGSLEYKDVIMSDDEDTREKKTKSNKKGGFPTPPYPKQTEEPKASTSDSNETPSSTKTITNIKPVIIPSKDLIKVSDAAEKNRSLQTSNTVKNQPVSNISATNIKEVQSSKEKTVSTQQNSKSSSKPNSILPKKIPRIVESSSSSSTSSSSDDSSTSSDSDSSSSDEEEDNKQDDNKAKEKGKRDEIDKESNKVILDEKMPCLTPQVQAKVTPPMPALNPAPIPQKRLKTKNVPPNPDLHKNKPPLISNPNIITSINKSGTTKNKEIFLGNSSRAASPNASNASNTSLPRNQSPSGLNLSYGASTIPTSGATIIKIPTPKSTPTPTSSPLGLGGPIYTSATSSVPQMKPALPLSLLKPKPKPRLKKITSTPAPLTAEDIFKSITGLSSLTSTGLLSQAGSSSGFPNKPLPKARPNKLTQSPNNQTFKGTTNNKKSQRLSSTQFSPKNLKLKSKHGINTMLPTTSPLSSTSSAAAAMLAFSNNAASQIASLTALSSFRPPPLTSAVEITKLRPAHLSSTSSASTNPSPFKSLSQQLGTGITVTEVGDKLRSTMSTSSPSSVAATASAAFVGANINNNNNSGHQTGISNVVHTTGNSASSNNNSMSMNRILQSITITPTPLLNLSTSTSGTNASERNTLSDSNVSNFSSASRGFNTSGSVSLQKPLKHITPYDVNALLGKLDTSNATSASSASAMKASIEKIMLGNGLNPREHQKK